MLDWERRRVSITHGDVDDDDDTCLPVEQAQQLPPGREEEQKLCLAGVYATVPIYIP